jgi:putative membrane protein
MSPKDHDAANRELAQLAESAKIPLLGGLLADHEAMKQKLNGLEGRGYDLAYMAGQITDHQRTAHLLELELPEARTPACSATL